MLELPSLKSFSVRGSRARVAFGHDVLMAALSFLVSLYLRVDGDLNYFATDFIVQATAIFTVLAAIVFWAMRLYAGVWRYASIEDLVAIVRAVSIVILVFLAAMFLVSRLEFLPRSSMAINWLVLIVALGAPRFIYRLFKDRRANDAVARDAERRIPVLLVGAGDAAELFIRAINRARQSAYHAVGIVDEKGRRVGRDIHGVPVLGDIDEIPEIIERLADRGTWPQRMIITKSNMEGDRVQRLLELSEKLGMTLARMPRLDDFRAGLGEADPQLKPIEIADLLGRPQTTLDRESMAALIGGKRILVTGAGGTIGSELCRQIAALSPASMTLLDSSEYQLYEIDLEIGERAPEMARHAVLADIRDIERIDRVFAEERPELVFHAAALKHVPMVEMHPEEGILTNITGTRIVADACRKHGAGTMVLISTDKAVNPSSLMGASKRIAESYCQALDLTATAQTRFVTVRFGNVLGSTGSVVPLFQRQLAAGGPLTVTHPEMTRYFMTVREAVELVLQASTQGAVAEQENSDVQGKIHVLDMGEPVRIVDLARQIILLAGLQPDIDIKIEFTGPRPGEKLYEEVLHEAEPLVPTNHPGILLAAPRAADLGPLVRDIDELTAAAANGHIAEARAIIERLVPEYKPSDKSSRPAAATG